MDISTTFSSLPPLLQPLVSNLWQDYNKQVKPTELNILAQHPLIFDSLLKYGLVVNLLPGPPH